MSNTKTQSELTGFERFGQLEEKIYRVVDTFKVIRKENEALRAENQRLKAELDAMCESESAYHETLAHLQKEREELRERVENALSLLASLEAG